MKIGDWIFTKVGEMGTLFRLIQRPIILLVEGMVLIGIALIACAPTTTITRTSVSATATSLLQNKGRIAFYAESEPYDASKSGLFAITPGGSDLKQLSSIGYQWYAWSPNGRQIAFVSGGELYVMNADGGGTMRLTTDIKGEGRNSVDSPPTWSPDGYQIAFESNYGYGTIYAINADGKNLRKITLGDDARGPSWSPLGHQIVFIYLRQHHAPFRIAVVNVENGSWQILSGDANQYCEQGCPGDSNPVWSPDGQKIVFSASDGDIHIMNADGSNQIRLTQSGGSMQTWSPDGHRIAFVSGRDGSQEIYSMKVDGSNQMRLTNNPANDDSPTWSPDGKQIAFVSERDGHREIYVMNADGSAQTRLTNSPTFKWSPAWAPR